MLILSAKRPNILYSVDEVLVTGGEPFIRAGIVDFLAKMQAIGLETSILSNGFHVPEYTRTHRDIMMQINLAQISLDAMNPELHDRRRGKVGALKQAIEAIETFTNISVPVEISCTVSQENINELKAIGEYCHSVKAGLLIRPCRFIGRGVKQPVSEDIEGRLDTILHSLQDTQVELVGDRFMYVPVKTKIDEDAMRKGIITFCSDGSIRIGAGSLCSASEASVPEELLEVA